MFSIENNVYFKSETLFGIRCSLNELPKNYNDVFILLCYIPYFFDANIVF